MQPGLSALVIASEWPGLKRTTVIISSQPPAMCRVANQQPRLPRATSSLALNACRDGASIPPWATCSVRHHPLGEKSPLRIQPKPPLSQFKTIPPCPITIHLHKQLFPLLFIHSLQVLEGHDEVSLQRSLLQAKQAQFPQPFLIGEVLQPSDHMSGPSLDLFQGLCGGSEAADRREALLASQLSECSYPSHADVFN